MVVGYDLPEDVEQEVEQIADEAERIDERIHQLKQREDELMVEIGQLLDRHGTPSE
jgi:ppGpp synthetase/RelA/SpoT-type nucleotidyltranferase